MPINPIPVRQNQDVKSNSNTLGFELSNPLYTLSDLILSDKTQSELTKAISLQKFQNEIFQDWGFSKTHKFDNKMIINLYGDPGAGKTMSAHAIADSLNRKIILVNYGDIESKYVGETPKNIKAAFDFAKDNNAILFFDEADAILSRRVTNMTSATDTSVNQTRSVMLNILNDYNDVVLFATNFISNYDPAFMRRILMHIEFSLPDYKSRVKLFEKYIPNKFPCEIDINKIAELSEGLSGSDISNAVLLSAFSIKVSNKDKLGNDDLIEQIMAIKKSKIANSRLNNITHIEDKIVSEEYVKNQLNTQENSK